MLDSYFLQHNGAHNGFPNCFLAVPNCAVIPPQNRHPFFLAVIRRYFFCCFRFSSYLAVPNHDGRA